MTERKDHDKPARVAAFASTQWSLVVAAGASSTDDSREALAQLCERYWYPLYAYVRRRGASADEAHDLVQEFFALLIAKRFLRDADPERGRFRAFLLSACKHFLANEYDRGRTLKRGGGHVPVSLDAALAEQRYAVEPRDDLTPERVYERRWALTLLERALDRIGREAERAGHAERFEVLKGFLTGDPEPYAAVAARLGISEGAAKVAVHRLRRRYREVLRDEIGATLADPIEVDGEIQHLFVTLGR